MTERNYQHIAKAEASPILYHLTTTKNNIKNQRGNYNGFVVSFINSFLFATLAFLFLYYLMFVS